VATTILLLFETQLPINNNNLCLSLLFHTHSFHLHFSIYYMFNFGDELVLESFRVSWLLWIQLLVFLLFLAFLFCFTIIASDHTIHDSPSTFHSTHVVTNSLQVTRVQTLFIYCMTHWFVEVKSFTFCSFYERCRCVYFIIIIGVWLYDYALVKYLN
jgi:hypothetical protein